ncbi:MAG: D-aminoacyl-tRNA deacylase [Planctomycetaceae bacterium]
MKLVVQRVTQAAVEVDGACVGSIRHGMLVLIGVGQGDTSSTLDPMVEKLINLRIFADQAGKMNRSVIDVGGSLLLISQFTLYADCRKGRRPAFTDAAAPDVAKALYESFVQRCRDRSVPVACGVFAADMQVSLVNDGPVTIILDSQQLAAN